MVIIAVSVDAVVVMFVVTIAVSVDGVVVLFAVISFVSVEEVIAIKGANVVVVATNRRFSKALALYIS